MHFNSLVFCNFPLGKQSLLAPYPVGTIKVAGREIISFILAGNLDVPENTIYYAVLLFYTSEFRDVTGIRAFF